MTCDEWRARLKTLQEAYDGYLTGGHITEVQTGDKRTRFSERSVVDLRNELARAQRMVDRCDGVVRSQVFGVVPETR